MSGWYLKRARALLQHDWRGFHGSRMRGADSGLRLCSSLSSPYREFSGLVTGCDREHLPPRVPPSASVLQALRTFDALPPRAPAQKRQACSPVALSRWETESATASLRIVESACVHVSPETVVGSGEPSHRACNWGSYTHVLFLGNFPGGKGTFS